VSPTALDRTGPEVGARPDVPASPDVPARPRPLADATLAHLQGVFAEPELAGTRYILVQPIGQGGMGTVYLARDTVLDRLVALKVLHAGGVAPGAADRLGAEARILARLEHPGIVPVHDAGVLPDGRVFYAMKYVQGERLADRVRAGVPQDGLLRLFERVCEAVAFAHANGVIHRDLKPENIMVGPFGEVLVMDWGVAKVGEESDTITMPSGTMSSGDESLAPRPDATGAGTILGTPGYMAPEQARGGGGIDARADVHALGAVLRFIVTGSAPDQADPPGQARTPRPLEAIWQRAMAPEPADRYPTAVALGEDVARYLAREPVHAYRERWYEQGYRVAKKHQVAIALVLAYLVLRLLLIVWGIPGGR
jgi:serine/threonine protein kinase